MHKIDEVNIKRLLPKIIWNIAPSKMSAAIIPTPSTRGERRAVVEEEIRRDGPIRWPSGGRSL